jgi:putative oxidoreductase
MTFLTPWEPRLRSLMRIVFALNIFIHGIQKAFGVLGVPKMEWTTQLGAAGWIETVGGALLLVGLFSRCAAFVLSGLMAAAYFIVHAPGSLWPVVNMGELAVLYSFAFLWFAAAGPGPWSLDAVRGKQSGK